MPEICDFTRDDGTTTVDLVRQAEGVLSGNEIQRLTDARINREPIRECVGSGSPQQGISPTVIGLGVLGLGAVAVALSQRDE